MSQMDEVKKELTSSRSARLKVVPKRLLSTGSTLLNIACSGNSIGGFLKGYYYYFVGDSSSGKTWLSLTCMAEAARTKRFEDYRFIRDDTENGALMDMEKYFGSKMASRLEAPKYDDDGEPVFSETIEEFYWNLDAAITDGRPFIYVLDSMDALTSRDEEKKYQETKKKLKKNPNDKVAGSYGDGKAKYNSRMLRRAVSKLKRNGSILIIISQTRDNIGYDALFNPRTRSGGKALKFYAGLEIWTSVVGRITKVIKEKKRKIGIKCKCEVKKNRLTGHDVDVVVPIYRSFGIDDTGGCIQYLIDEKHWKGSDNNVSAPEFEFKGTRDKLIKLIENNDKEGELRELVAQVWQEIEDKSAIKRKRRYD